MRNNLRLGYAANAAKLLLCAALLCAAAAGSDKLAPQAAPHFETEQLWGLVIDINWEPTIAAGPKSEWVYQLTSNQKGLHILFRSSSDGGSTWNLRFAFPTKAPARHTRRPRDIISYSAIISGWPSIPKAGISSSGAKGSAFTLAASNAACPALMPAVPPSRAFFRSNS